MEQEAQSLTKKVPINCPYCDESAYQKPRSRRLILETAIYTQRQCIMGHSFWSVEIVPEDQDEVEQLVHKIRVDRRNWRVENGVTKPILQAVEQFD